jgi:hypothetical protein
MSLSLKTQVRALIRLVTGRDTSDSQAIKELKTSLRDHFAEQKRPPYKSLFNAWKFPFGIHAQGPDTSLAKQAHIYNGVLGLLSDAGWIDETKKSKADFQFYTAVNPHVPVPRSFTWSKRVNADHLAAFILFIERAGLVNPMEYRDAENVAKNTFGCSLSRETIRKGKSLLARLSGTPLFREIEKLANGNQ